MRAWNPWILALPETSPSLPGGKLPHGHPVLEGWLPRSGKAEPDTTVSTWKRANAASPALPVVLVQGVLSLSRKEGHRWFPTLVEHYVCTSLSTFVSLWKWQFMITVILKTTFNRWCDPTLRVERAGRIVWREERMADGEEGLWRVRDSEMERGKSGKQIHSVINDIWEWQTTWTF